jgi:hypothetical protein
MIVPPPGQTDAPEAAALIGLARLPPRRPSSDGMAIGPHNHVEWATHRLRTARVTNSGPGRSSRHWIHPAMPELIENALLNLPLD